MTDFYVFSQLDDEAYAPRFVDQLRTKHIRLKMLSNERVLVVAVADFRARQKEADVLPRLRCLHFRAAREIDVKRRASVFMNSNAREGHNRRSLIRQSSFIR